VRAAHHGLAGRQAGPRPVGLTRGVLSYLFILSIPKIIQISKIHRKLYKTQNNIK
jgi:hypothetical protein